MLRIDIDNGSTYSIPSDNPYGDEIWAAGLRNPWKFTFDNNGDLWIADVGQNEFEEIRKNKYFKYIVAFGIIKKVILLFMILVPLLSFSQELVIGEERVEPGIVLIFEGAIKDVIEPKSNNLSIEETNVHIEARVNWDSNNIPDGTPSGGFIPYLKISSTVLNEKTGLKTFIDLTPHINLIDNFHYARNISLPGEIDDLYTVEFKINAPHQFDLAFHKDWMEKFGKGLFKNTSFKYENVDFEEIAKANRD